MSKYQKDIFYIANLIKIDNGKEKIYKENMYFVYEEETDKFISFQDVLNPSLDLLNPKLDPDERKELEKEIDTYKYSYIPCAREGEIYVDESSIRVVEYSKENKKKPRT